MMPEPPRHVMTLPGGIEMAFRLIPAGTFRMGSRGNSSHDFSEEPVHRVKIVAPFWLAETPVTQAQFGVWSAAEGIAHNSDFDESPDHPAENLDWRQANRYCGWLTRTQDVRLPTGYGMACLPTEAEWEYACRAGTELEYSSGDGEAALWEAGWYGEKWDKGSTHAVRRKSRNDHWLWDMHGNVWEWCHDVWEAQAYRRRVDGDEDLWSYGRGLEWEAGFEALLASNQSRVVRGGSWGDSAWGCRSAGRFGRWPGGRLWDGGFRVCLVRGSAAGRAAARNQATGAGADAVELSAARFSRRAAGAPESEEDRS